jgi:hypothetical protein
MPIAESGRHGARNRAFSGTGWSVDGDRQPTHEFVQNTTRIRLDPQVFHHEVTMDTKN